MTGKAVLVLLLLALLLSGAAGCSWNEYWTFGATRWAFEGGGPHGNGTFELLVLLLCVDVVLLPVTLPHDIWLLSSTGTLVPVPETPAPAPPPEDAACRAPKSLAAPRSEDRLASFPSHTRARG